jgi:5-methylcytosine-specific restriction enzyme A
VERNDEACAPYEAARAAGADLDAVLSDDSGAGAAAIDRMVSEPRVSCRSMQLARRPCASPGCPELVERGYCAAHAGQATARQYDRARRDDPQRMATNSTRWLKLRRMVLARDPVCKGCGEAPSTDADHIVPIREGGAAWSLENLQGLCASCHAKKTRREEQRNIPSLALLDGV